MIPGEIKKILHELTRYKRNLIIVAVAGIVMSLAQAGVVASIKVLFDAIEKRDLVTLEKMPFVLIGLYLVQGAARYFHLYLMNFTSELVIQGLREKLQKKFMNLSLTFHNNYISGSGGLISRVLNDMSVIQNGLRMFADFFREPLLLVILLTGLFVLNWRLTSTIIIVLPLILYFLKQISRTIKTHSIKGQEDLEKITSTIKESLDGVRVIQSFNLEKEMGGKFEREASAYLFSRKKIHSRVELAGPVTEFIAAGVIASITIYLSLEIAKGNATFGDLGGYLGALLGLSAPIKKIQESYVRIQETNVAAKRVFSLLDEKSEVPQVSSPTSFPRNWKTITYKNVSFSYGSETILKNFSLTIHRGEMVAFVGASGSGKSTLVNLLERFFDPTEGDILIDGVSIQKMDLKELRKNIALVTQDVFLFSDSIERNIWSGDFTKPREKVQEAARSANAHNFIMKMPQQYESRVGDRGNLLSGGEKQRISIARAFLKDAPILILDEATSALDSASEVEVQKGLDQLMQGRTALVIAHRLSTIAKADRIIVLANGEIVEQGTHEDLVKLQGEYHKFHSLQR